MHELACNMYILTSSGYCGIYIYIYSTRARTCLIFMNPRFMYIYATATRTWQINYNHWYISCSLISLASPASWYISLLSIDRLRGMHMLQAGHTPTWQLEAGTYCRSWALLPPTGSCPSGGATDYYISPNSMPTDSSKSTISTRQQPAVPNIHSDDVATVAIIYHRHELVSHLQNSHYLGPNIDGYS